MADFCTVCANEMGFSEVDIPVEELFASLDIGFCIPTLCEGCGLMGILKNDHGEMEVAYSDFSEEAADELVAWEKNYEENSIRRFHNQK